MGPPLGDYFLLLVLAKQFPRPCDELRALPGLGYFLREHVHVVLDVAWPGTGTGRDPALVHLAHDEFAEGADLVDEVLVERLHERLEKRQHAMWSSHGAGGRRARPEG